MFYIFFGLNKSSQSFIVQNQSMPLILNGCMYLLLLKQANM